MLCAVSLLLLIHGNTFVLARDQEEQGGAPVYPTLGITNDLSRQLHLSYPQFLDGGYGYTCSASCVGWCTVWQMLFTRRYVSTLEYKISGLPRFRACPSIIEIENRTYVNGNENTVRRGPSEVPVDAV